MTLCHREIKKLRIGLTFGVRRTDVLVRHACLSPWASPHAIAERVLSATLPPFSVSPQALCIFPCVCGVAASVSVYVLTA